MKEDKGMGLGKGKASEGAKASRPEIRGPRDYLGEHKKRQRKKEEVTEANYEETEGKIHGSVYNGSVRDGQ